MKLAVPFTAPSTVRRSKIPERRLVTTVMSELPFTAPSTTFASKVHKPRMSL